MCSLCSGLYPKSVTFFLRTHLGQQVPQHDVPTMDLHYGPPLWTSTMDPHYGPPLWTPQNGPQYGSPIWTPTMDPCPTIEPHYGQQVSQHDVVSILQILHMGSARPHKEHQRGGMAEDMERLRVRLCNVANIIQVRP
jgi:hypothetical protein